MILRFNYEELRALSGGARALLARDRGEAGSVVADGEARAGVEELLTFLEGDLSLDTLAELWRLQSAVASVVAFLRVEMESVVVATHVADEGAVAAYFDFAHTLTVAYRIAEAVEEMDALIELMTGAPTTPEAARAIRFPD